MLGSCCSRVEWPGARACVDPIDEKIRAALQSLPPKPADSAKQTEKKRYSEQLSAAIALAVAAELKERGFKGARPTAPGELDKSGAERRMSGGIGAKKV